VDVADASFARVSAAELLAAGYEGIMRYTAGVGKAISKGEYDALIAGGVAVGLVHEGGVQQAMRGYAGGVSDALVANAAADALGHPRDRPVVYVLEDPSPLPQSAWPTVVAYCQGVGSANGRPVWGYGSGALITHCGDAGLIGGGWEVSSWPGAGSKYSKLRQMASPTRTTLGGRIDQNIKLSADWGGHPTASATSTTQPARTTTGGASATPPVIFKEDNVQRVVVNVPIAQGHGWVPVPGGDGTKVVSVVVAEQDPVKVHGYPALPVFVGVSTDTSAPGSPVEKLVFGPGPGAVLVPDGNYGAVVWLAT